MALVEVTLADGSVTQVPYPRVPPKPGIGSRRRQEMARKWLVSLSQAPTPERVEALAPLVGRFSPRSPLGRIASQFVAANRVPVCEDVVAVYLHRQAIQRRRMPPAPIEPGTRARVLELIDEHWAVHSRGPDWSQLGAQVGLGRHDVAHVLRELNRVGAVHFTTAPRLTAANRQHRVLTPPPEGRRPVPPSADATNRNPCCTVRRHVNQTTGVTPPTR